MQNQNLSSIPFLLLLVCSCSAVPTGQDEPTRAQSLNLDSPWTASRGELGWSYDVALGFESEPDYAGSDDAEVEPGVLLRALYKTKGGHRPFISLGELGGWWRLGDQWVLGTIFEYEEGRDMDNPALQGFEEVESTLEAQITLARRFGDWTAGVVVQPDLLGRGKGLVLFGAVGYDKMLTNNLRFSASADLSTGDSTHMVTEFGVSSAASTAGGLSAYDPGAGLKSASLDIGLEYFWGSGLSLLGGVSVEHYLSSAADSPLIADEGSDRTYEWGLSLRYSF